MSYLGNEFEPPYMAIISIPRQALSNSNARASVEHRLAAALECMGNTSRSGGERIN
jgi:hypothetical protein